MIISDLFGYVDAVKPNNFDNGVLIRWLNEIEGRIQTEIYLIDIHEIVQYEWNESWSGTRKAEELAKELLVTAPYDNIYTTYLLAEIDNANGEYNRYANTKAQFDKVFGEYSRYIAQHYAPGNRHLNNRIKGREAWVDT